MRRGNHRRDGQALVEFALLLPLLVLALLGLADLGLLLRAHVEVANAAREGARAGSLYLGGRFHYTSCSSSCPAGYGDGGSDPGCWTLQAWVENGLVEHNRSSSGCPLSAYDTAIHAFGQLNPAPCTSGAFNCWELQPLTVDGLPITGTTLPVAGRQLKVQVIYRYRPLFVADLIPMFPNTVQISKTVLMKVQNN